MASVWPLDRERGHWAGRCLLLLALATSGQSALPLWVPAGQLRPRLKGLSRCLAWRGAIGQGPGLRCRGHQAPAAQVEPGAARAVSAGATRPAAARPGPPRAEEETRRERDSET